ncbi:MAG: endonuclease/exonuclease/phosphatase family protein [Woeseiaceae bacterium]
MNRFHNLAAATWALLLAGCALNASTPERQGLALMDETSACAERLVGDSGGASSQLDALNFGIVNWNIQKGKDPEWVHQLTESDNDADLFILQEAVAHSEDWDALAADHFRSFSEGFGFGSSVSGVMTLSTTRPLAECELVSLEPWFGTRKATLVTEYALTTTEQTLLVVNIHGINFTFGVSDLKEQLLKALAVIAEHQGPVLFSGDFNTWHGRRAGLLDEVLGRVGLTPLEFRSDYRKRFLGWPLDHIFVRGLDSIHATTREFDSSDHNPMSVRFRLTNEEGPLTTSL